MSASKKFGKLVGNIASVLNPFSGPLEKMVITPYLDKKAESLDEGKEFTVQFNPTTYKRTYTTNVSENIRLGRGAQSQFNGKNLGKISFKVLFDGTGVSEPLKSVAGAAGKLASALGSDVEVSGDESNVYKKVSELHELLMCTNPETHEPNIINVKWGTSLNENVRATGFDVDYKIFDTFGDPLRAEVSLNFVIFIPPKEEEKVRSSDISKVVQVQDGDTLPLIAYREYGDSKFYRELARVNNLTNIRKLVPGQELLLPPVDKSTT